MKVSAEIRERLGRGVEVKDRRGRADGRLGSEPKAAGASVRLYQPAGADSPPLDMKHKSPTLRLKIKDSSYSRLSPGNMMHVQHF